jgi:hypothetical protein
MDSERKEGIGVSDTDLVFGPVCVSRTKFHTCVTAVMHFSELLLCAYIKYVSK